MPAGECRGASSSTVAEPAPLIGHQRTWHPEASIQTGASPRADKLAASGLGCQPGIGQAGRARGSPRYARLKSEDRQPACLRRLGGYRTSSTTQCKLRRVTGGMVAPRRRSPNRRHRSMPSLSWGQCTEWSVLALSSCGLVRDRVALPAEAWRGHGEGRQRLLMGGRAGSTPVMGWSKARARPL